MTSTRMILQKQLGDNPKRLSIDEAIEIYRDAELNDLAFVANERRRWLVPGNHVTYLVDRNINYTNVCNINCQFCSFYRQPGHPDSYTLTFEDISKKIAELEQLGGSRVLMQGGVNPVLPLQWYIDLIANIRLHHPGIALDCFSPIEIEGIADVSGMTTIDVLSILSDSGMHGLPGGGAEMLVDTVRNGISPLKGSADNWIRVMMEAQEIGLVTSATNVFGFGETIDDRVEHFDRIRTMQDNSYSNGLNGFTSFISWPVMLENNSLGRGNRGLNRHSLGAGAIDYLRHLAVSRIFFDNVPHIQASWPTMGMNVAQLGLLYGADDLGSTMMEENVVSSSGSDKSYATIDELRNTIISAGFEPMQRDSQYRIVNGNQQVQIH